MAAMSDPTASSLQQSQRDSEVAIRHLISDAATVAELGEIESAIRAFLDDLQTGPDDEHGRELGAGMERLLHFCSMRRHSLLVGRC